MCIELICIECDGKGYIDKERCKVCQGKGLVEYEERDKVYYIKNKETDERQTKE